MSNFFFYLVACCLVAQLFIVSSSFAVGLREVHAQPPMFFGNVTESKATPPAMPYNGTSLKVFAIGNLWVPYTWNGLESYVEAGYGIMDIIRRGDFSYIIMEPPSHTSNLTNIELPIAALQ